MRVGIDVGGTTVKIGFIDDYKIIKAYEINTKKETLFDEVLASIKKVSEENNYKIDFVGFGLPGVVKDNIIVKLPNIGIHDYNLQEKFNEYFDVPMASSNDANVAALGEVICDPNAYSSCYMITLGTGVGGGFVLNNEVINGNHSSCGEIGHTFIDYVHNYKCSCGLSGCLETVASATGIVRLAREYYNKYETSLNYDTMDCKAVMDAAKNNDPLGLYVYNLVCDYLGRAIANIACTTDVEAFYIGGGVSKAGEFLLNGIKKSYSKFAFYGLKDTIITLAKLGNNAGMLGAAYLVKNI